jgi:hypothetical protein
MAAFLLVTNVIPATVPVAAALAFEELRRGDHGRRLSCADADPTLEIPAGR